MATILIVDDHVLNRQFLMVLLGYSGHSLIEAADGAEGLDLACARRPDLVIAGPFRPLPARPSFSIPPPITSVKQA
jgi:response regulator RpfG family c-di-GMP phosphodiesterase